MMSILHADWVDGLTVTILGRYRKQAGPEKGELFVLIGADAMENRVELEIKEHRLTWSGTSRDFVECFSPIPVAETP
jgi:hypothetical protein